MDGNWFNEWLDNHPVENKDKKGAVKDSPKQKRAPERWPVSAALDLHGCRKEEAQAALEAFLRENLAADGRKVLIVHGKGLHSRGESVLKEMVYKMMEEHPLVGKWGQASAAEGGSGAVWAVVRKKNQRSR